MPKISMPTDAYGNAKVDAVRSELNAALAQLDYLLGGRIDTNNLLKDDSGNYLEIPTKKVKDYPDISRPVNNCIKFHANQSTEPSFEDGVFTLIHDEFQNNADFTTMSATASWGLSKDVLNTGRVSTENNTIFDKKLVFDKPTDIVPVSIEELYDAVSEYYTDLDQFILNHFAGQPKDDYVYNISSTGSASFDGTNSYCIIDVGSLEIYPEAITCPASVLVGEFGKEEYANVQMRLDVLCKRLK